MDRRERDRMPSRSLLPITTITLLLVGCYNPRGAFYSHVGQAATYWSTESKPTTITLMDTSTGEPFFTLEIPVGKQLVLDFKEGEGDDDVRTPDMMRYQVFDIGTTIGMLRNTITVPGRNSRRIDVSYRAAPEYAETPSDDPDRVDLETPDWWTPKGGRRSNGSAHTIHDG